jgi:hypothetical protein
MATLKRARDNDIDEDAAARCRLYADCMSPARADPENATTVAQRDVSSSDYQAAINQLCSPRSRSLLLFRASASKVLPVVIFRTCAWDSQQGLQVLLNSRLQEARRMPQCPEPFSLPCVKC